MSKAERPIVVITGGASGIGASCAELLAKEGYMVVLADVQIALAREVAAKIGGLAFAFDATDEQSIRALARQVEQEAGPVYGLVNSAGITQAPLPPEAFDVAQWDRVQSIDFRGSYLAALAFSEGMRARRRGAIVNISSVAGSRSMPLHSYAPAKAAVISMTQCLAAEWGPSGIRVNAVAPGYTLTPMLQEAKSTAASAKSAAPCKTPRWAAWCCRRRWPTRLASCCRSALLRSPVAITCRSMAAGWSAAPGICTAACASRPDGGNPSTNSNHERSPASQAHEQRQT